MSELVAYRAYNYFAQRKLAYFRVVWLSGCLVELLDWLNSNRTAIKLGVEVYRKSGTR